MPIRPFSALQLNMQVGHQSKNIKYYFYYSIGPSGCAYIYKYMGRTYLRFKGFRAKKSFMSQRPKLLDWGRRVDY